jgi:hypothetical protein
MIFMNTLLLDQSTWDLVVDASGNIAAASNPYSLAQDAASECKTVQGEVYYDTTRGIPYFSQILGQRAPLSLIKAKLTSAALLVPEVTSVQVFISAISNRTVSGQIQIPVSSAAQTIAINF